MSLHALDLLRCYKLPIIQTSRVRPWILSTSNWTTNSDANMLPPGALIPLGIWNSIEVNVGVICACLPIMRPLLRVLLRQNIKNLISKSDKSKPPTSRSYWPSRRTSSFPDNAASFICLDDVPSNDGAKHGPKTTICGPGSEDIQLQELERSYAKTGIRVEHNITWTWVCLKLSCIILYTLLGGIVQIQHLRVVIDPGAVDTAIKNWNRLLLRERSLKKLMARARSRVLPDFTLTKATTARHVHYVKISKLEYQFCGSNIATKLIVY